jgi:hypothetical protein
MLNTTSGAAHDCHRNVSNTTLEQSSALITTTMTNVAKQEVLQHSVSRLDDKMDLALSVIPRIDGRMSRNTSILQCTLPKIQDNVSSISQDMPKLEAQILLIPEKVEGIISHTGNPHLKSGTVLG